MDSQEYTDREEQKKNLRKGLIVNSSEAEPEDAASSERDYERKLRSYRRKRQLFILIMTLFLLAMAALFFYWKNYNSYDHLDVVWSQALEPGSFEGAVVFGDGIVKYGRDSASYIAQDGTVIWTESYEMSKPAVSVCGTYLLIYDRGANTLMVCSTAGKQGQVTTAASITKAALAGQGMSVVILEDTKSNYLAFYDRTGKKLDIEIKTLLQGNGYPLDVAVSESAAQLMVSYAYVESGAIKNKIVFYNFDVGQDMVDRIVGGFEQYDDSMIPKVTFLNEKQAVAFGDNILSFYSLKNQMKPALVKEIAVTEEIQAVFYNSVYAGIVTRTDRIENPYHLMVCDGAGEIVTEQDFNTQFTKIEFVDDTILLYNKDSFIIYEIAGGIRYQETFDMELSAIVPSPKKDQYFLIGNGLMQAVELE